MDEGVSETGESQPTPEWVVWVIRMGAAGAMGLAGVLLYESLMDAGLPGCGVGSGCDVVLGSRWSKVMGTPVAAAAVVVYAVMLGASLHVGVAASVARRRGAWRVLLFSGGLAAVAAVWFVALQAVVLEAFCTWCTVTHGVALATAVVIWRAAPIGRAAGALVPPRVAVGLGVLALASVAVLAGLQQWGPFRGQEVVTLTGPGYYDTWLGEGRRIGLLDGALAVSPGEFQILGSPDAVLVVAELMDYTCPHCRELHEAMKGAKAELGDRLAVIPLPMPLDADCNDLVTPEDQNPLHATACELADLALAVHRADAGKFGAYHDWLFSAEEPPTPEAARAHAAELVGEAALERALADPWIGRQIQNNIRLYKLTPRNLPILLMPTSLAVGTPDTHGELMALLRAELAEVEVGTDPAAPATPPNE